MVEQEPFLHSYNFERGYYSQVNHYLKSGSLATA